MHDLLNGQASAEIDFPDGCDKSLSELPTRIVGIPVGVVMSNTDTCDVEQEWVVIRPKQQDLLRETHSVGDSDLVHYVLISDDVVVVLPKRGDVGEHEAIVSDACNDLR